jgi:uncharacterized membrane protein
MTWLGLAIGLALVWLVTEIFGSRGAGLAVLGALVGMVIGAMHKRLADGEAQWRQRVAALEQQLQALTRAVAPAPGPATEATAVAGGQAAAPAAALPQATPPTPAAPFAAPAPAAARSTAHDSGFPDWAADAATADAGPDTVPAPPPPAYEPRAAAVPRGERAHDETTLAVTASLGQSVLAWFKGGNTIVRVAVLILFVGVALLLRHAAQNIQVSLEMRVAGVALGGLALAGLGWRLRHARRVYGLTLQGAGVGIVYITLFAAYRLYQLVPAELTFALLTAMAAITALLAVLQNALPLAVFGFGGGFLAPVLASTGSGNHVALFSYYLLLNLAIAWIARRQAWKLLNLLGFVFTFSIGAAWGARAYTPEQFASTEPFLVAHFLLYLFISVQYTRHLVTANETRAMTLPTVDGGLLFGVPIAAFGLQAAMLRGQPYALALSAAVLSGIYLLVGRWLWRVAGHRMLLLVEGLLALGVVFLALVTPLALDARWTGVAWAAQGAGIVWVGLRQQRLWAVVMGLLLQAGAALSFWSTYHHGADTPVLLNQLLLGAAVLAASALVSSRWLWRAAGAAQPTATGAGPTAWPQAMALHWVMLVLGLLQAWGGLWGEVMRLELGAMDETARSGLLAAAFVLALEFAQRRLQWPPLRLCARVLVLGALALSVAATLTHWGDTLRYWSGVAALWQHYVAAWGAVAALLLVALAAWLQRCTERQAPSSTHAIEPALLAWGAMWHAGLFVYVLGAHAVARHLAWTAAAAIAGPTLIALWLAARGRRPDGGSPLAAWPMQPHGRALRSAVLLPWLGVLMLWVLVANAAADGSMAPLPYLPLLNPLDLAHGLVLLYALAVARLAPLPMPVSGAAAAALAFWWLNSLLVRTLHHWAGTALWPGGALQSALVQTSLTILWTLTACAAMWLATRRAQRLPWMAGAVLLAVVVLKLFFVDLSNVGTLARIVSFLGVGGLMLVIGYLSPLPPAMAAGSRPRART